MGEINPIRRGQVSRGRNPVRAVNKCNYRASSHFRMILSSKLQAALTMDLGYCKISIERNIMDTIQLKRIADAIEEILRLVKKDMEKYEEKNKK